MNDTASRPGLRCRRQLSRGIVELEMKRFEDALGRLQRAVAENPADSNAWFWLARCHEDLGHRAECGYCYTLALCCGNHGPARQALKRLGLA